MNDEKSLKCQKWTSICPDDKYPGTSLSIYYNEYSHAGIGLNNAFRVNPLTFSHVPQTVDFVVMEYMPLYSIKVCVF